MNKVKDRLRRLEEEADQHDRIWFNHYAQGVLVERECFSISELIRGILEHLEIRPHKEPSKMVFKKRS